MIENKTLISNAFQTFWSEAPDHAQAWGSMVQQLSESSALDSKTKELSYLSVLAALNHNSGIPFHVKMAKDAGATRKEIISAILIGLPAAGHIVTQSLPAAILAFDEN